MNNCYLVLEKFTHKLLNYIAYERKEDAEKFIEERHLEKDAFVCPFEIFKKEWGEQLDK